MDKGRLEAFSDGMVAIFITVMVLEMKVPHEAGLDALRPLVPVFLSYILSFVFLGIYWNNHHHLFQAVESVNGRILWANLHLLFWLSAVPFVTAWMGENHTAPWPVAIYGLVLLFSGIAYFLLVRTLLGHHGPKSALATALGSDTKGWVSIVVYALAVPLAFVNPYISEALFVIVALMWLIPDRRIEDRLIP